MSLAMEHVELFDDNNYDDGRLVRKRCRPTSQYKVVTWAYLRNIVVTFSSFQLHDKLSKFWAVTFDDDRITRGVLKHCGILRSILSFKQS